MCTFYCHFPKFSNSVHVNLSVHEPSDFCYKIIQIYMNKCTDINVCECF